jgi:hypothetical protein
MINQRVGTTNLPQAAMPRDSVSNPACNYCTPLLGYNKQFACLCKTLHYETVAIQEGSASRDPDILQDRYKTH